MKINIQERRVLAVIGVVLSFGVHYSQISTQPTAVLTWLFSTAAIVFITFEYYRSSDTRDIKATVAAIRMDQTGKTTGKTGGEEGEKETAGETGDTEE